MVERSPRRLLSLDVFRGFVVASMLLVNTILWNNATPRQLMHAPWARGVTFTDMILPWFVFSMGVAIPLHSADPASPQRSARVPFLKILRRAAVLVGLGIFIDSLVDHRIVVGLDVLQLLGLAYLVAALLSPMPAWGRLTVAGVLLAGHWALIEFAPVPGYGAHVLEEQHNIIRYLDDTYLARYHLSGLLSVGPASALALLGTAAGDLVRTSISGRAKFGILVLAGLGLAFGGMLWSRDLPLSKFLWTSSYAVVSGGVGLVLLGICYLLFDVVRLRAPGFPFAVFGTNAILAYVAPILVNVQVLEAWHYTLPTGTVVPLQSAIIGYLTGHFGAVLTMWIYTGMIIVAWWLILLGLYRKHILVRV